MSLYQSYRPHVFSDVVGQDFVKKILANSCRTQTFHHGYIFFGFHGIGKTTLARIFAEAVNCTNITPDGNPCHACQNCLAFDTGKMIDVVEMDAASHTSIENMKEIIEHSKFTPTQGKYKIYIIDEIHMLSTKAFNALLKTLEEPPAHVIFLLATTQISAVPDTILSRVIRFDLNKIGEKDMEDFLMKICRQEGVVYEEKALQMITHRARGSIRDALTMLEKCIIDTSVTEKNVEEALHLVNFGFLRDAFEACVSGKAESISHILDTINSEGIDVQQFSAQMTEWVVDNIAEAFEKKSFGLYREIFDLFTRVFVQSKQVSLPMDILKMALYERITSGVLSSEKKHSGMQQYNMGENSNSPVSSSSIPETLGAIEDHVGDETPHISPGEESAISQAVIDKSEFLTITETHTPAKIGDENTTTDTSFSSEFFLQKLQEGGIKSTLLPLLRTAHIARNDNIISLHTTTFAQNRCSEIETRTLLENTAAFFGCTIEITADKPTTISEPDMAQLATSIFG